MIPVKIIGIGLSPEDITIKQDKLIKSADLLIGGTEQLKVFKSLNVKKLEIKNNLSFIVEKIQKHMDSNNIVVLASGDPLFYGIGAYLINKIGKKKVKIYPNISSVAKAFSRINEPWQEAQLISLHGDRSENISSLFNLAEASEKKMFCVLTDTKKDPAWIAQKIIDKKDLNFTMCVFERLGTKNEKITWYEDLTKVGENKFVHPNIVILKRLSLSPDLNNIKPIHTGMEDHNFFYKRGLITKSEIRSIVLSKLNFISENYTFWDLGAGSGSVSIEASALLPNGSVYAVEKDIERINVIKSNTSRFNTQNIKVIHAQLPEALEKMPIPDRIFIGGGGKGLKKITECAINKLSQNGIIVVNTVLIQNLEPVVTLMKDMGLKTQSISVQISRSKSMPYGDRFESLNPVWIIIGKKEI